jgi:sterol O-acyltransferase
MEPQSRGTPSGDLLEVRSPIDGLSGLGTPSESTSDEEYDGLQHPQPPASAVLLRRRRPRADGTDEYDSSAVDTPEILPVDSSAGLTENSSFEHLQPLARLDRLKPNSGEAKTMGEKKTYVVASDDAELREILKRGLERVSSSSGFFFCLLPRVL